MGILIQNGKLVFPDRIKKGDLYIDREKISKIEESMDPKDLPSGTEVVDASGLYIFPGFIDAHTHYGLGEGETGTADGFFEGSRAAAFGGITTFIDFADQISGMTLTESSVLRIKEAEDAVIDFSLHQGVYHIHRNLALELDDLKTSGIGAVKLFTTYKEYGCYLNPADWSVLFPLCRNRRILITIHAEDDDLIKHINRKYPGSILPPKMHALLRPAAAEKNAVIKAGESAALYDVPVYIVHLSSETALDAVRKMRGKGVRIFVETTPHYLFLTADKLEREDGARFIMTPPLRKKSDNEALIKALASGEIDVIATDHCSYTPERKEKIRDCRKIPAGIPGSEEMAALLYSSCAADGSIDLIRMGNLLSVNPARIFGLYPGKGSLEPGTDADIVLFSTKINSNFSSDSIHSKAGYTAYEGFPISGVPVMTILRGKIIIRDGKFLGNKGDGHFIKAGDSSVFPG